MKLFYASSSHINNDTKTKSQNENTIVIIDDHYFDVTEYIDSHPGGKIILKKFHLSIFLFAC